MTDRTPHITYILETRAQYRHRRLRIKATRVALVVAFMAALFMPDKLMNGVTGGMQAAAYEVSCAVVK